MSLELGQRKSADHLTLCERIVRIFSARSTTKDFIRAEGDFHKKKRYIVERTNKAEIRPEEQSAKVESCPENLWNTIERAIKTETDTRTE